MVKITNKHGLPSPLVVAAKTDTYSRGASDISVTELIDAPRLRLMRQVYDDQVERDVSDVMWPMLGSAFHELMERGSDEHDCMREERMFGQVEGWTVSGQVDRVDQVSRGGHLKDYKVTSVYTAQNPRDEWTHQLNLYGALLFMNYNIFPKKMSIIALCRDWRPREAQLGKGKGYPQTPLVQLSVPPMGLVKALGYLRQRVRLHQDAQKEFDETGEMPLCTDADRWATPDQYALFNSGRKRASAIVSSPREAEAFQSVGNGRRVERRDGADRRCERYCEFEPVCAQIQKIRKSRLANRALDAMNGKVVF